MKTTLTWVFLALWIGAAPVIAQEAAESAEVAEDQTAEVAEDQGAEAAEESVDEPAEEAPPEHDWEFALQPTDNAPEGTGIVQVTDVEEGSQFVVAVEGLPLVDEFDTENRDVNAYTVWIVPSKDRVPESALAGVITVGPEGTGSFEGSTSLGTFGIILTATQDGAPERITGVPVLTGIPVSTVPEEPDAEGDEAANTEGVDEEGGEPAAPADGEIAE